LLYINEFINVIPKVELHLHLEGSIRPETAIEFYKQKNPNTLLNDYNELKKFYRFDGLPEFISGMKRITNNIQSPEQLQRIASELLETLASQQVYYVEFDCAIQKYLDRGYVLSDIVNKLYETVQDFEKTHHIKANMLVNLLREHGPAKAEKLVKKIAELNHPFVVGIGLSGDETLGSHQLYKKAFQMAKEANLHRTAHAGESLGAESIWQAIKYLDVERIDHGTRANSDERLINYLVENNIPLTQCISSNYKLKVVNHLTDHPFYRFLKSGVCVTLNTDDPHFFDVSITDEYQLAAKLFQLSPDDLKQIVLNSIQASFLSEPEKKKLQNEIIKKIDKLVVEFNDSYWRNYFYSEARLEE